jgi:hypothetical protein
LSSSTPRSLRSFSTAMYSTIAVLDVVEAGVVGVEHLARVLGVQPLLGALAPRARRAASRGSCGYSSPQATARPCGSSRESSLSACSATASGISASAIFRPILLDDRALVFAELLADRVKLPAQDVLALLLLDAGLDVLLMRRRTCMRARRSRCSSRASSSRSRYVDRLEAGSSSARRSGQGE